jgi:glycosyltransferase involved in cell wall biosynthesis
LGGNNSVKSIGAVVCTLNSEQSIGACLSSLINCGIGQIVIVDGGSTDSTLKIVKSFAVDILKDPGLGLGLARNIGIQALTTEFVLVLGSDNIISEPTLDSMMSKLGEGFLGVSCRTRVKEPGYIARCSDLMWRAKIQPGKKMHIGTPQLFSRKVLSTNPFSLENSFSDDTELCHRLTRLYGGVFFTVPEFCEEIGKATYSEFRNRYRIYGLSDWELYKQNKNTWSRGRKIKSLLHPLRTEFMTYVAGMNMFQAIFSFPLILGATFFRYRSWLSKSWKVRIK